MKMKKNFLYIIAFLSVLVACTEEKIEVGTPLTGQEVKFSVSMGNDSRTIYGAEETDEETGGKKPHLPRCEKSAQHDQHR